MPVIVGYTGFLSLNDLKHARFGFFSLEYNYDIVHLRTKRPRHGQGRDDELMDFRALKF